MKAFSRQKIISRKRTKKKISQRKIVTRRKKVASYKNPEYKDVGRKYKKKRPPHPLDHYIKWGNYWSHDYHGWGDYKNYKKEQPLTNEQKELIINQVLNNDEGKVALAAAMIEPIRKSLGYQAISRKFIMVDELPEGVFVNYGTGAFVNHATTKNWTTGNWSDIEESNTEEIADIIINKFPSGGDRLFDMDFEDLYVESKK